MKADFELIRQYTKDCPVITSAKDTRVRFKTNYEKMIMLLTDFYVGTRMSKINMQFKAGETFDDVARR